MDTAKSDARAEKNKVHQIDSEPFNLLLFSNNMFMNSILLNIYFNRQTKKQNIIYMSVKQVKYS
jgi:hypothetical protein